MATQNRQKALMNTARAKASFNSRQLTYMLYGGQALSSPTCVETLLTTSRKEATKRGEGAFNHVEDALGLSDTIKLPSEYANQDRKGYYLDGLAFGKAITDDEIKHRHRVFDYHSHQFALISSSPFGPILGCLA